MLVHGKVRQWHAKTCQSVCSPEKQDSLNKRQAEAYVSRLPALNKSQTHMLLQFNVDGSQWLVRQLSQVISDVSCNDFINFVKLHSKMTQICEMG